jgi:hypothetical protein
MGRGGRLEMLAFGWLIPLSRALLAANHCCGWNLWIAPMPFTLTSHSDSLSAVPLCMPELVLSVGARSRIVRTRGNPSRLLA